MRTFASFAAAAAFAATLGHAAAQSTAPPSTAAPSTAAPNSPPGSSRTTTDLPRNSAVGTGAAAATGDRNQAVATTSEHAVQPARGANSFSEAEARNRIQGRGYAQLTTLAKDQDGVWRADATKDGRPAKVWLDYKGNVGQN